ncbi:MAG: hypothetical protein AB7K52_03985 [Phycisphaerales bacterium]
MTVSLVSLWLPVILAAMAVFFASSVIWMALPIHKNDYHKLGDKENAVMDALRSWGLPPGLHMFPMCDPKTMKDNPDAQAKMKSGPWGTITLMASPPSMGSCLGMWIVNLVVSSLLIAYVASISLPAGSSFMNVFRLVATVSLLTFGGSVLTESIWRGRPWSHAPGALFDAVVYACITGAIFGAMWPAPSGPTLPL